MRNTIWTTDPSTCSVRDLKKLFNITKLKYNATGDKTLLLEQYVILNWYRSRMGEPSALLNLKDIQWK